MVGHALLSRKRDGTCATCKMFVLFRLGVMSATTEPSGHLSSRAVSCSFRVSAKFDAFLGRYSHGKQKEWDRPSITDDCLLQIPCFEFGEESAAIVHDDSRSTKRPKESFTILAMTRST
jgi:hypothetical protein